MGLVSASSPGKAALVLEEQFDYPGVDQPLNGKDGGLGFADAWTVSGWGQEYNTGRTIFSPNPGRPGTTVNADGGLEFGDHPAAGSALARYGTAGQKEAHRTLSAASQAALTADGTTIWFSVLAGAPNGNKYGTLIFGTDPMIAQQGSAENANLSSPAGQAFGVGFRIDNGGVAGGGSGSPNAVAFIGSASATVAEGTFIPVIQPDATHHDTVLIVGKINWNADGTEDELFLFNMAETGLPEPAEGDAIASLTADFDQANFDTIALQDTGSTIYDEIRFGTSFSDVTGGPKVPFVITDFDYDPDTNVISLTWNSRPGEIYIAKYSPDMSNWDGDLEDGIVADDGEQTTWTYDLGLLGLDSPEVLFFRMEKG